MTLPRAGSSPLRLRDVLPLFCGTGCAILNGAKRAKGGAIQHRMLTAPIRQSKALSAALPRLERSEEHVQHRDAHLCSLVCAHGDLESRVDVANLDRGNTQAQTRRFHADQRG